MRSLAVDREDVSGHIVAGAHPLQDVGVALRERSELRVTALARSGDIEDGDVMEHPPFIPATLVVNDEQWRDVGEDIVEGAGVVWIGGKSGLGLQHHTHGAERGQSAISPGGGQLHVAVIHPGDYGGKDVALETARLQQVISCPTSNTETAGWLRLPR